MVTGITAAASTSNSADGQAHGGASSSIDVGMAEWTGKFARFTCVTYAKLAAHPMSHED
jgi:hypothetical protein